MLTYQDFAAAPDFAAIVARVIAEHRQSALYRAALDADEYDAQRNITARRVAALKTGQDPQAGDGLAVCSNFFNLLNNQRKSYLLGNGVSFTRREPRLDAAGRVRLVDATKETLGPDFDTRLNEWGYFALIHGVAFGFWNRDRLIVYPITQFAPLWDETTGALRAGIRFWQLDARKPVRVEVYEEDGYTLLATRPGGSGLDLAIEAEKQPYKLDLRTTEAGGAQVVAAGNYPALPVIPMWGSRLKQSTLVGMRGNIDAYDLIYSGLARTLDECASIYWIIQNCGGMDAARQRQFLRDIRENHIAQVDTSSFAGDPRGALRPYAQEVPVSGPTEFLKLARERIYADFGALDVHALSAAATNDHIDAAYQPMDDKADDFEYQVIDAVQALLRLLGIEDTPQFRRNRVANVKEQVDAVMLAANALGRRKTLEKLPIVSVDEVDEILAEEYGEDRERLMS